MYSTSVSFGFILLCLLQVICLPGFGDCTQQNNRRTHNTVIWAKVQPPKDAIKKVHVVFMNHLDVGYYDGNNKDVGFAAQVLNLYLTEYFKRAINLSETLVAQKREEKFIYTSHPWLISLYLNCPDITLGKIKLKCPNKTEVSAFMDAVRKGYIAWHAAPMNMQTDNMGVELFNYSLKFAQQLNNFFGKSSFTYSQRDVPGLTKSVIPILMANGIKAISVGVNPGTPPPVVPSVFLWKLRETDHDGIIAMWDKGGYPLNPGPNATVPGGLAKQFCHMVPGCSEALCFAFRTDNTGPPMNVSEILNYYKILRTEFPGADVVASTFDNFVEALKDFKSSLPIVSTEIGDTWIQGIASDPIKTAFYRAFDRAVEACFRQGACQPNDHRICEMMRYLIKLPEHTWGAHNFLDTISWSNAALASKRKTTMYQDAQSAWNEQRQFIDLGISALKDHPVKKAIQKEFEDITATRPDLRGYLPVKLSDEFKCPGGIVIQFASDGSLRRLYDPFNKVEWASSSNPIAQWTYDTYSAKDYDQIEKNYNYLSAMGFEKPNITKNAAPESRRWEIGVATIYKKNDSTCDFWLEMNTLNIQTQDKYGAPQQFYTRYVTDASLPGVNVTAVMLNKVTTRLPESISFGFSPSRPNYIWLMSKMGQFISPCNVVENGSQYAHGVDKGIVYLNASGQGLAIVTMDTPVVLIGQTDRKTSPFPLPLQPLKCSTINSMAFNVFNNIWDTNYIYWYPWLDTDQNFKARYQVLFHSKPGRPSLTWM